MAVLKKTEEKRFVRVFKLAAEKERGMFHENHESDRLIFRRINSCYEQREDEYTNGYPELVNEFIDCGGDRCLAGGLLRVLQEYWVSGTPKYIKSMNNKCRRQFINNYEIAVKVAKEEGKALLSVAAINAELKELAISARKHKQKIRLIHGDTIRTLDSFVINNGLPTVAGLDAFDDGYKKVGFPFMEENRPFHLAMDDILDTTILLYEKAGAGSQFGRHGSKTLFKLESDLAISFKHCEGEIRKSESGDFANILRDFRKHCGIEGFDEEQVSAMHVSRISKSIDSQ